MGSLGNPLIITIGLVLGLSMLLVFQNIVRAAPVPTPPPTWPTWDDVPYPRETPTSPRYTNPNDLMNVWISRWFVSDPSFWRNTENVKLYIDYAWPWPAATSGNVIHIQPEYADPGVLAHEICHVAWPLLSQVEQQDFSDLYPTIASQDKLVALVTYGGPWGASISVADAQAEIYRFLGVYMPNELKKFYPHLISL